MERQITNKEQEILKNVIKRHRINRAAPISNFPQALFSLYPLATTPRSFRFFIKMYTRICKQSANIVNS